MERYRKLTREGREELQEIILITVYDLYAEWRRQVKFSREYGVSSPSEPCITAAWLFGYFEQAQMPAEYKILADYAARREIHHAMQTLHRKGMLARSVGESSFGREAYCYEPGDL